MNNGWSAKAIDINDWDERLDLPTERILNYRFTNANGQVFRLRLLDNGRLEINCNSRLVVYPRASNEVELEQKEF